MACRISRQGWRAYGGGLILFRGELELAPGGGCGPIINCRAELNLAIHNAIINDVDKPAPATLFLEALAHWRHPLAICELVIPEAAHTRITSPRH